MLCIESQGSMFDRCFFRLYINEIDLGLGSEMSLVADETKNQGGFFKKRIVMFQHSEKS